MTLELSATEIERDLAFAVEAARSAGRRALALRHSGRWKAEDVLADIGDQACDGFLQGMLRGRAGVRLRGRRIGRRRGWL